MRWSSGNLLAAQALATTFLIALVKPSLQFTLVQRGQQHATSRDPLRDAVSVRGKLGGSDNGGNSQASHPPPPPPPSPSRLHGQEAANGEGFPTPDSTDGLSTQPPLPAAANSGKTNRRGRNFQTSRRLGRGPTESGSKSDTEDSFNWGRGGSTTVGESNGEQVGGGVVTGSRSRGGQSGRGGGGASQSLGKHQSLPSTSRDGRLKSRSDSTHFTEVVEVDSNGPTSQGRGGRNYFKDGSYHRHDSSSGGGVPDSETAGRGVLLSVADPDKAVLRVGRSQALKQQVHSTTDLNTHVPKMVLTVVGSVTAIFGVCVMAAIFQCCCRRKRGSGSEEESSPKKEKEQDRKSSRSSRSKSPSPQKVVGDEGTKKEGQSEQEKLLEEDEDLGDFSAVQRETEILRSYRKPPPPKNRARASRVPRALKTLDSNMSPNVFQELAESDEPDAESAKKRDNSKTLKPANGLTPEKDMQSSMLADIDNTLAALHSTGDNETSPSTNVSRSREPSLEKPLATKTDSDNSRLKPPNKEEVPSSPSREELAKVLAQELSRSVSKEALSKPQSKTASPQTQSKETTPKSSSAGASPKLGSKGGSASESKDNVGSGNGSNGSDRVETSPEEGNRKEPGNIFALIDPTAKDNESEAGDKSRSKIPVRAASSPTQPTAQLRQSWGKEKRFPVPSVHGEQMDQLLKSLKTRLKEDGASPKRHSNKISPEDESASDDLEPRGRDRSHSDPSKQKEEKKEKFNQTNL